MVKTLGNAGRQAECKEAARIVEIIGLAEAGKTTFLSALCRRNEKIQPIFRFRNTSRHVPFFIRNAPSLLSACLSQSVEDTSYTWREIKWKIRVTALHLILRQEALKGSTVCVDQGPLFTLTTLLDFGSEYTKCQGFRIWWDSMLEQLASTLDMVIWLDAPDETLLQRIRARKKWHLVKEKSDQEAKEFLMRYRTSYEQTVSKLTAN